MAGGGGVDSGERALTFFELLAKMIRNANFSPIDGLKASVILI